MFEAVFDFVGPRETPASLGRCRVVHPQIAPYYCGVRRIDQLDDAKAKFI
jgi:hypothetical protein